MSTPDERIRIHELVDVARQRTSDDKTLSRQKRVEQYEHISYLFVNILKRIDEGRSYDCDEYRSLLKLAGKAS